MASQSRKVKGAGRPIQYDRDAAIEAATLLFYEKGFKDSSVQDVVAATGMQTGSVYAAFGSKLALFIECLEHDLAELKSLVDQYLHDDIDPLDGLVAFASSESVRSRRSCFSIRALVEFPDRESDVWQRVATAWRERDDALQCTIRRGQEKGLVRTDLDACAIERHLTSMMIGGRFLVHYMLEPEDLGEILDPDKIIDFLRPRT